MASFIRLVWGPDWTGSIQDTSGAKDHILADPMDKMDHISEITDKKNSPNIICLNSKRYGSVRKFNPEALCPVKSSNGLRLNRYHSLRRSGSKKPNHLEQALLSPDIRVRIEDIKEWLVLQDYIQEEVEDEKILAFLHSCYYDVKSAQKSIIKYFETKSVLPELLCLDHDSILRSDRMRTIVNNFFICPLDHSVNNQTLIYIRCKISDPHNYDHFGYLWLLFAITEMCVRQNPVRDGFVLVFDSENMTFANLKKCGFRTNSVLHGYYQGGLSFRIKDIFIINASYLNISMFNLGVFGVPFGSPKVKEKIHFYKSRDIHRFIKTLGKENVPEDYEGGTAPSLEELHAIAIDKLCDTSHSKDPSTEDDDFRDWIEQKHRN